MDQSTATLKLPWLDPNALQGFIDELREAGYSLDTRHYSAAQDLILALVARRERFDDPDLIQGLLGPLLCSSPVEQEDFPGHFQHWVSQFRRRVTAVQLSADQPENSLEQQLKQIEKKERRWQRLMKWSIWGILVATALTGLSFFVSCGLSFFVSYLASQSGPALNSPRLEPLSSPRLLEIGWTSWLVLLLLPVAAFTVWRLWWRYQAKAFLVQRAVSDEPQVTSISVKGIADRLFQTPLLLRAARELRRHIQMPSTQLDQDSTVAETVLKGGWFTPVYSTRPVRPEYLMLLDRASYQDQRARFVDEWLSRLEQYGVFVSRYYFDGDPRLCFPQAAAEAPLALTELASAHPHYRLLIFAEAKRFFNPRTGELEPWIDQFQYWETRVLLTPEPEIYWGQQERLLAGQFLVLPGTAEGLDVLIQIMQSGRATPTPLPETLLPLPETLQLHPQRWLARDPVNPDVLVSTLVSLKYALGDAGYLWLCACAVYPALDWNLTLYLGDALHDDDGRRLLESGRLNLLLRLPWFRQGSMPDWLRSALVSTLSKEQEEAIRAALQALLLTALTPPDEGFTLAIAQKHKATLSVLAKLVLRRLSHKASADSPLKDYVFTSFLAGHRVAVRVPRALRKRLVEGIVSSSIQGRQWAKTITAWSFAACFFLLPVYLGINSGASGGMEQHFGFPIETLLIFFSQVIFFVWLDLRLHRNDTEISLINATVWVDLYLCHLCHSGFTLDVLYAVGRRQISLLLGNSGCAIAVLYRRQTGDPGE